MSATLTPAQAVLAQRLTAWLFDCPRSGCHVWLRARQSAGYGVIRVDGRLELVHRVAWFLAYGTWPAAGLVLDHRVCDRTGCANVGHLVECGRVENTLRSPEHPRNVARARRLAVGK